MARNTSATEKARALDAALRALFRGLQARAMPDNLRALVDQLEEARLTPAGRRG